MKRLLPLLLLAAAPCFGVTVDFRDENNVSVDGANAGCLADVKANHARNWADIGRQVVVKVRERCSDKAVAYAAAKSQVAAAEACGLAIPAADKADMEKRKP